MENSDLVELLGALTKEEVKRLITYLETCDAGKEAKLEATRMVHYITDCRDEAGDSIEHLEKEQAYSKIFPGKPFVVNKLEKSMSDTLRLVRNFVAAETAGRNMSPIQQSFFLQKFFNDHKLESKFIQARRHYKKLKQSQKEWPPQDYYYQFLSESEEFEFQSDRNQKKDDLNLWETIHALDEYYLVERLWHTCILLNQNQLAPLALPPLKDWFPFELNSPKLQWFFEKPLGYLFFKTIELLSGEADNDEIKFKNFVQDLYKYESQIFKDYLGHFEVFACNYGIRRLNRGHKSYANYVFQIQKRRILSGRIYRDNKIKASEFQAITTLGLWLKEYEWVNQFLTNHQTKIFGSMPSEDYFQFMTAHYQYHLKNLEPAFNSILNANYEDMQCKFLSKLLEIKILWEMSQLENANEWVADYLENKVEAAILYFFREKNLPLTHKKMGKRFADTMKRIIHADGKRDAERLKIIQQDIAKAEFIAERQWLSNLTEELITRYSKK